MAEETTLIRDIYNQQSVQALATAIQRQYKAFNTEAFVNDAIKNFAEQSYSQRADAITAALTTYLPADYLTALEILVKGLPPENKDKWDEHFHSLLIVPITRFVSRHGLDHFKPSMLALFEMTKRLTAEWDIRPFIERYTDESLQLLQTWAQDPNQHVRRLVSEGTRPRLPWGSHLKQFIVDPEPVLHLLEQLKNDPELYVRRSVANNLNDIAKDHPDKVVKLLQRWQTNATPETAWIIKHASRTLVKQGHAGALQLLGYNPQVNISLLKLTADEVVTFGKYLNFELALQNTEKNSQALVIDYAIHFMKANGLLAPKVFKLKTAELKSGEKLLLTKRHAIKPISTRTYYAGKQELAILVNGRELKRVPFKLQMN